MLGKDKRNYLLGGLVRLLLAELCCFIVAIGLLFTKAMGITANIIFGFCSLAILLLLFADYCIKKGQQCKKNVTYRKAEECENFGFYIGLVGALPCFLWATLEVLSKMSVISNFHPYYKLLNMYFMPIIDIFAHDADIANVAPYAIVIMFVLPMLIPLVSWIAFKFGYNEIDITEKLIYKKPE